VLLFQKIAICRKFPGWTDIDVADPVMRVLERANLMVAHNLLVFSSMHSTRNLKKKKPGDTVQPARRAYNLASIS
jgi:hypothetical protein